MRIAILLVALAFAARAQETPRADRIRTLSDQLQIEYDLAHYEKALGIAEELYRLKPTAGVLFNVAQCHRKLGQFKEAATLYRSFIARADPASPEAVKAQELLGQVEALIKQQEAVARAPPQGTAPLKPEWQPRPQPVAPPPVPPPAPSHKTFYVLAGISAAALAGGVVMGLGSKSAASELTSSKHALSQANSLADTVKVKAVVADGFFLLSLGFGLGAVIAW